MAQSLEKTQQTKKEPIIELPAAQEEKKAKSKKKKGGSSKKGVLKFGKKLQPKKLKPKN